MWQGWDLNPGSLNTEIMFLTGTSCCPTPTRISAFSTSSGCVCVQSHPTLWNPMDCSLPCSSVRGTIHAGYWRGLPFPSPGDLPDPEIEPASLASPALAGRFFTVIQVDPLHHLDHHNKYNNNEKVQNAVRITRLWHKDREWTNAVGKMVPIDLLPQGLPWIFIYVKHSICRATSSAVKWGMPALLACSCLSPLSSSFSS